MNDLCIVEVENDVFDVNRYDTALIKLAAAQEIKCNLFCNQIQVNLDNDLNIFHMIFVNYYIIF